jgi:hypothetical protein
LPPHAVGSTIAGDAQQPVKPRTEPDEQMAIGVTSRKAGAAATSVLASMQVTGMLPVKDMARARRFYEAGLGNHRLQADPVLPSIFLRGRHQGPSRSRESNLMSGNGQPKRRLR